MNGFALLGINSQCQASIPTINNKTRDVDTLCIHTDLNGGFASGFYCSFHITHTHYVEGAKNGVSSENSAYVSDCKGA